VTWRSQLGKREENDDPEMLSLIWTTFRAGGKCILRYRGLLVACDVLFGTCVFYISHCIVAHELHTQCIQREMLWPKYTPAELL
jgi:hypothetical protein